MELEAKSKRRRIRRPAAAPSEPNETHHQRRKQHRGNCGGNNPADKGVHEVQYNLTPGQLPAAHGARGKAEATRTLRGKVASLRRSPPPACGVTTPRRSHRRRCGACSSRAPVPSAAWLRKRQRTAAPDAARKPSAEGKAVTVVASVPESLVTRLDALAKEEGRGRSQAITEAVRGLLKRKKR